MSRLQSWIFVSLALVIFPLDGPGFGATRPTAAQRCAAAKIAAAAKKARADLACRAKGVLAGGPPDSACLLKAQQAFAAASSRADRRGGCVATGDVGQRLFFLHDGRTSDLLVAIKAHFSRARGEYQASEANAVVKNFLKLRRTDQQAILDFLRSL